MYPRADDFQQPAGDRPRVSGALPNISTERIMLAVEEQRRVSQQLEDLRFQQQRRTARLQGKGFSMVCAFWGLCGVLVAVGVLVLWLRPILLERALNSFSDGIGLLVALGEQTHQGFGTSPFSNWLLSLAGLVMALLTGLWVRLMRLPQDR